MKRLSLIFLCNIFILLVSLSFGVNADPSGEEIALASAVEWLSLVDEDKFGESWDEAASLFKKAVPKDKWLETMNTLRDDLGEVISRKFKSKEYRTSLPGAPVGEYFIILYETSFKNKESAVEMIAPMLDEDGIWRVSGYRVLFNIDED